MYSSTPATTKRPGTSSVRTLAKPAPRRSVSLRCGLAMLNGPGAGGGLGGRDVPVLEEADPDDREEGVSLEGAPDRQRQPTARAQDAAGLGERRGGIGPQHVAEPARRSGPLPSQRSVTWARRSGTDAGAAMRSASIPATSQIAAIAGRCSLAIRGSRLAI
jgi:hypothetical protein